LPKTNATGQVPNTRCGRKDVDRRRRQRSRIYHSDGAAARRRRAETAFVSPDNRPWPYNCAVVRRSSRLRVNCMSGESSKTYSSPTDECVYTMFSLRLIYDVFTLSAKRRERRRARDISQSARSEWRVAASPRLRTKRRVR